MSDTDKMNLMRKYFERIQPLPDDAWQVLLEHMREKKYSKSDVISSAGSTPDKIGILHEGVIRAYISNEDGAEYTKTIFTHCILQHLCRS